MYQGYMKRGFSLLLWFCGICAFVTVSRVSSVLFLLPAIWAYSFFDAFNLRALSDEQRAAFADAFIPNPAWADGAGADSWRGNLRLTKVAGWALVAIGSLVLFTNFRDIFLDLLYSINERLADWIRYSSSMAFGLVLGMAIILLGVRMLRGRRGGEAAPPAPNGDTPPPAFTAPPPDPLWQALGQPPAAPEPDAAGGAKKPRGRAGKGKETDA
jgi:hypothetical protein